MTRLIDADSIYKWYLEAFKGQIKPNEIRFSMNDIRDNLENIPTIEAEPVRHGKWIIRDNPGTGWYRVTCSECGEDVTATAPCIGFFPNAKVIWDYCPNCGADMRGETNE